MEQIMTYSQGGTVKDYCDTFQILFDQVHRVLKHLSWSQLAKLRLLMGFLRLRLGVDFSEIFSNSTLHQRNKALVKELSVPPTGAVDIHFDTQYAQSAWGQFTSCLWKFWWAYSRNPDYNLVCFTFTLLCALMVGSIFWKIGNDKGSSSDLTIVIGAMYSAIFFVGSNNCQTVQPVVAIERTVFYRERAAGMYSSLPYAMAQVFVEIPYIYAQCTYYMAQDMNEACYILIIRISH